MNRQPYDAEANPKFWSAIAVAFGLMFAGVIVFTAATGNA